MSTRKMQSISEPIPHPDLSAQDVEQTIRQRAYHLYLERGQVAGSAEDDWLKAEQEILGNLQSRPAAA